MRAILLFLVLAVALSAQPNPAPLTCELRILRTHIGPEDPIEVDVWVENQTDQEVVRPAFNPLSSIAGTPKFLIRRLPDGLEFVLPPGLYGPDGWHNWYQAERYFAPNDSWRIVIGPRQRVHLLRGNLKRTILRAREHCQRSLADENRRNAPDTESTRKSYEEIVRRSDDFLTGGTFEIRISAYALSPAVQVTVAPFGTPSPITNN